VKKRTQEEVTVALATAVQKQAETLAALVQIAERLDRITEKENTR
jgi:hypothetical protein